MLNWGFPFLHSHHAYLLLQFFGGPFFLCLCTWLELDHLGMVWCDPRSLVIIFLELSLSKSFNRGLGKQNYLWLIWPKLNSDQLWFWPWACWVLRDSGKPILLLGCIPLEKWSMVSRWRLPFIVRKCIVSESSGRSRSYAWGHGSIHRQCKVEGRWSGR